MQKNKKIICLQEIGKNQSCIVVEDVKTRVISYLTFRMVQDSHGQNIMHMIGLGVKDEEKKLKKSKLLKFRSTASFNEDTEKWYFVGIVLRENGRVEVYADFILVDHFYDPNQQCVDIEIGNNNIYLKIVKDSLKVPLTVQAKNLDF